MNDEPLPIANARALIDVFHRHEQYHKDVQTSMEVFDTFQPEGARKSEWVERRISLELDTTNNRNVSRMTIDIRERTQRIRMLVLDHISNMHLETVDDDIGGAVQVPHQDGGGKGGCARR